MTMFTSKYIFQINENIKYSYKSDLSFNSVITIRKESKNHNIKSRTYRRWSSKQRETLYRKGKQSQTNVMFRKMCIRPKAISKTIKIQKKSISYAEQVKNITFRRHQSEYDNFEQVSYNNYSKISNTSMIFNKKASMFMNKYSF